MVSMNEKSENPEFMKTIEDIRDAEKEYDLVISRAREKADGILRKAKETIQDERESTQKELVEYKNEKIRGGSKVIEAKVDSMVKKAREESSGISKMKPDKRFVAGLAKDFVSGL
jgi:vacuolar-type H+-ATPase subunit H